MLALQCSKKLISPMTLTLLPKSTSTTSTKSPLRSSGNSTFFWRGHGQNIPFRMHQNMPFQVKTFNVFSVEGSSPLLMPLSPCTTSTHPTPSPIKPSLSAPASPRIPARCTPVLVSQRLKGDQLRVEYMRFQKFSARRIVNNQLPVSDSSTKLLY